MSDAVGRAGGEVTSGDDSSVSGGDGLLAHMPLDMATVVVYSDLRLVAAGSSGSCSRASSSDDDHQHTGEPRKSLSRFRFRDPEAGVSLDLAPKAPPPTLEVDDDGDLVVPTAAVAEAAVKQRERFAVVVGHTRESTLATVGLQVWRGALLLCDFMIDRRRVLAGSVVLELGSGSGLAAIVAARCGATTYATDYDETVLSLCQANVERNAHVTGSGRVAARRLDWFDEDPVPLQGATGGDEEDPSGFGWNCDEVAEVRRRVDLVVAADCVYDTVLTEQLFRVLEAVVRPGATVWITMEKRFQVLVGDAEPRAVAFEHFLACLEVSSFESERIDPDSVPQWCVDYDRTPELDLWVLHKAGDGDDG